MANALGMDLSPTPDGVHVHEDIPCNVDLNGDRRLNIADVLTLLDVSEECERVCCESLGIQHLAAQT